MIVALALVIGLTPYHGSVRNGSIPGSAKFGVVVSGNPHASVGLRAIHVPPGWIASFCTDVVCSPFRVQLSLPRSGRQTIELQFIRNADGARSPRLVTVESTDGQRSTIAFKKATL